MSALIRWSCNISSPKQTAHAPNTNWQCVVADTLRAPFRICCLGWATQGQRADLEELKGARVAQNLSQVPGVGWSNYSAAGGFALKIAIRGGATLLIQGGVARRAWTAAT
jgi:hypothetical protein